MGQGRDEEGVRLLLAAQGDTQGAARRHEGAGLVVVGGLDVEEHRAAHLAGGVAEQLPAALGELGAVLRLVVGHEAEERRRLGGVVLLHLVGELLVALVGLLLDEDGQVEGVLEGQAGESRGSGSSSTGLRRSAEQVQDPLAGQAPSAGAPPGARRTRAS